MKEDFNKLNKNEEKKGNEKESLYANQLYWFQSEYGNKYPEVGWQAEYNGIVRKITKVFKKGDEPYIKYEETYLEDVENELESIESSDLEKEPTKPEEAEKKIEEKTTEVKEEISKKVTDHKVIEEEAVNNDSIEGEEKLEEERDYLVKKSKKKLDKLYKRKKGRKKNKEEEKDSIEKLTGDKKEVYENIEHLFKTKYINKYPKVGWEIEHEGEKKTITRVLNRDGVVYVWYKTENLKEKPEEEKSSIEAKESNKKEGLEKLSLSEELEKIEKNLDKQPKSVQDLFNEMKDNFVRKEVLDNKNNIFSSINERSNSHSILALVEDDVEKGIYKTRVFRFSKSDHQWKSIPGLRENGDFKKGDEENENHHYVQSAKLHKDIYKVLNQLPLDKIDINFQNFLPKDGNNYDKEFEFKENYQNFKDKKWESSKAVCQIFYRFYSYLVTKSSHKEDFSLEGGLYESLKNLEDFCEAKKFSFGENISNLIKDIEEINSDPKNAEELKATSMEGLKKNFYKDANENLKKLLNSYHGNVSKFTEEMFKCKSKKIFPETMMPEFSEKNCIDRYTKKDITGDNDINIEEYKVKSESGDELIFAMAYDSKNRVYVDNIYNPNSKMSSYGTLDEIAQMGHLVYKPEDYDDQAGIGFPKKYKEMIDGTSYSDINKLWENVPVIDRFKKELINRGEIKVNKDEKNIEPEKKEVLDNKETKKETSLEELNKEWDKTREEIREAEKNDDKLAVSEAEEKIRKIEEKIGIVKRESGDDKSETSEVEKGEGEINEEILKVLEEINVNIEEMKNINGFEDLSPGAQLLALNNYKQIIDDEAVKLGLGKFSESRKAKKEKYQEKYGKRKGSILSGITNIFGGSKKREVAYKESLSEIKNKEFDSKLFALEASVNWVTGADISAEIKEGKIEFNFINKSELNEEAHEIVDELNSIANKFAKMPQYLSNISSKKSDRKKYEKTKQELEEKKLELARVLEGKESDSDIISQLNKLNFKITNLQNNLTDEDINELEKSNSKFLKFFKTNKWAVRGYFFLGGMGARSAIKRKFGEAATDEALDAGLGAGATALASYGTLGVAAAIGGFRGWKKAEQKIREDDKKIGKKEETETMKIRKEKLEALRYASPENIEQAQKEFDEANKNFLKEQMKNKTEANFLFASKANKKIEKLMENINELYLKESLSEDEKNKLRQLKDSLKNRLKYTKDKIDDGLIALGSGANRLVNSSNLFNSISKAEMLVEGLDYEDYNEARSKDDYDFEKSFDKEWKVLNSKKVTDFVSNEFIDDKGRVDIVAWLNQASPEEVSAYRQRKIDSYLNIRSKKIDTKRRNYKVKKAAVGAVMGAGLAYGGMKSFDALSQTETGQFIGEKLSDLWKWGVDQGGEAVNYLKGAIGGVESLEQAVPSIDDTDLVNEVSSEGSLEAGNLNINEPEVDAVSGASKVEGVDSSELQEEGLIREGAEEGTDNKTDSAYIVTPFEELEKTGSLTKTVSKGDSVWNLLRNTFEENAKDLGYEGDINDTVSLKDWADNQTANAIERTGDIKDLIYEGNEISLVEDQNGEKIIDIKQGTSKFEPGYLPEKVAEEVDFPPEANIPSKMESKPLTELKTKEPYISGLNPAENSPLSEENIEIDSSESDAEGLNEPTPEESVENVEAKNEEEVSNYDKMSNLVESIGKEDGLKSDLEQTYDKWADNIEKQRQSEVIDMDDLSSGETDESIEEPTIVSPEDSEDSIKTEDTNNIKENNQAINEQEILEKNQEEVPDVSEELGKRLAESWIKAENISRNTSEIKDYLLRNRHLIPQEALEDLENTFVIGGRQNIFGKVRGGVETSLANELNKIVGIEDFYQNLNEFEQAQFKRAFFGLARGNASGWGLNTRILSTLLENISKK